MIENWNMVSEEEEKFEKKEAKGLLAFSRLTCVCILPVAVLGIWQGYDIDVIYKNSGIPLEFLIISIVCVIVTLLFFIVFLGCREDYKRLAGGILYRSKEGIVEKIWQEIDGRPVTGLEKVWQEKKGRSVKQCFSFVYRDLVTGEVREYKREDYGKSLQVGDTLYVLACKKGDSFIIADVSKWKLERKSDPSWIFLDGVILAAMFFAWKFLYLDFGAASLYIRLWIYIVLIVVAVFNFFHGIVEKKKSAIVISILLCAFIMLTGVPDALKNIAADLAEGPQKIMAGGILGDPPSLGRAWRVRRSHDYVLHVISDDTDMKEVGLTINAYYYYYRKQYGTSVFRGELTYYPRSKIFLHLRKEEGS